MPEPYRPPTKKKCVVCREKTLHSREFSGVFPVWRCLRCGKKTKRRMCFALAGVKP